ncbi:DNA primase [Candidatus Roizmanbacteria bacterium]|nr:DNA primase [Candidatus Roizmanbacteria bacterium]
MEDITNEVKARTDIVELVGSYVELKKAGRNYKGLCPFHHEKSPSFMVAPERQLWRCFGACGEGGDAISFLMKYENITFTEALKELALRAGIKIEKTTHEDFQWKKKERLLHINTLAAEYFHYILLSLPVAKNAREYLEKRLINQKIVNTFQIGYAPNSWDSLLLFLKKKNIKEEEIEETGLSIRNASGRSYDRFRGRLMFPIRDIRGSIIGFSGRILDEKVKEAKYVNTPETTLYHKRESLFGIHLAKEAIRVEDNAILVEGEFDMIMPFQHGISNIVAIKGAAVTREQIALLKRCTNKLTLILDSDAAGEEAMRRGIEIAEEQECEMHIVTLEGAKDPDEAVRKDLIAFKKAVHNPIPVYDFLLTLFQKKYADQGAFGKKKTADDFIPFLDRIKNPIVKSHYLKKLSALLEVSDESITEQLKKVKYKRTINKSFTRTKPVTTEKDRYVMLEKNLFGYILQHEEPYRLAEIVFSILKEKDFFTPAYGQLALAFQTHRQANPGVFDYKAFIEMLPAPLVSVCDELYMIDMSQANVDEHNLLRLVLELKKLSLKHTITEGLSEEEENTQFLSSISQELKEVEKKLATL